ncbi:hypothetical protein P4639_22340 [Priestia megaterium]|uniref:hypothetical protein n=1 Tax=Priestia megaterium TaxID=1404 RepID=UPI002E1C9687|nr:hypothetical protein [Priestia megaterium]
MTIKKLDLLQETVAQEIKKGDMLKRHNDLFIVAEVVKGSERSPNNPIDHALFGGSVIKTSSPRNYRHASSALRKANKMANSRYSLISIATGYNYFESQDSLQELTLKIINDGKFEEVKSIQFTESY